MDGVFKYINLSKADRKNSEPFQRLEEMFRPTCDDVYFYLEVMQVGYKKKEEKSWLHEKEVQIKKIRNV